MFTANKKPDDPGSNWSKGSKPWALKVRVAPFKNKNGNSKKETTILAEEFIRHFLLHVLPDGYMRIRYFGFLGSRYKKENMSLIRKLLDLPPKPAEPTEKKKVKELILELTGKDITKCPKCKIGIMVVRQTIPKPSIQITKNFYNPPKIIDTS